MNYLAHGYYSTDEWSGHHMYGDSVLGWVFMLLMMTLLVLGAVLLVRFLASINTKTDQNDDAQQILKQRYAKGEITKKQFDAMKKDLK